MKAEPGHYVLDSFAVLAYLEDEAGAGQVNAVLTAARQGEASIWMSIVNFGEVVYITEREQGLFAAQRAIAAMDQLPLSVVDADRKLTLAAAKVKAHHGVSYADAFAVALAQAKQATVLTGAPEVRKVEALVTIDWLPNDKTPVNDER
ncbi:MAG: type II toxin-antitoxin system VapC family toxin [Anaerolineae bacterium]